jgi:hypothetical protein
MGRDGLKEQVFLLLLLVLCLTPRALAETNNRSLHLEESSLYLSGISFGEKLKEEGLAARRELVLDLVARPLLSKT